MTGLLVYRAINAVAAALAKAGIPKTHSNEDEGYEYRSIDDVLNRLAPLLVKHRLCVCRGFFAAAHRSGGEIRGPT
jgi:hypothetical protein